MLASYGAGDMSQTIAFTLMPADSEIPDLIKRYHQTNSCGEVSDEYCLAAGARIRGGDFSKENLRVIYRWKMDAWKYLGQEQKYFDMNTDEAVAHALRSAVDGVNTQDIERAFRELESLNGIGLPLASAILTAIFPEQFTVIDIIALRALGAPEKTSLSMPLYLSYLTFCSEQARRIGISLRDMDRALWQWRHERSR
jgi:thermostable 8-oxoguanine DNA glycosylase